MLRYALRRALWILPALIVTTWLLFWLVTRLANHAVDGAHPGAAAPRDLPLFINPQPRDVRALSTQAVEDIANQRNPAAAKTLLVRLGGAALPFVLPRLDALGPEARGKLAMALQPVAQRMGLDTPGAFESSTQAVAFWTRFWEERAIDFKPAVVRRAVRRQAIHGSAARRAALLELDTYALPGLMDALNRIHTPDDVSRAARLLHVASHVTGRDACVVPGMDIEPSNRCVNRWREWWLVRHADYEVLSGPERLSAMLTETQYGLWALQALTLRLGVGPDGVSVLERLTRDGPRTVGWALFALLFAYAMAFPLAIASACWRERMVDHVSAAVVVVLLALPVPLAAVVVADVLECPLPRAAAMLVVILALITIPWRHQRVTAIDATTREWFRFGHACGLHPARLLLLHVGRISAALATALIALDFPLALSAMCVVEHAFELPGLGAHLVRATVEGDVTLLMAFGLGATVLHAVLLLLGDVATGWLDPRLRRAMHGGQA